MSTDSQSEGAKRKNSTATLVIIILACLAVFFFCIIGGLAALLLPAIQAAREAARRSQCDNQLKQISLALLQYETAHGQFPPAYFADVNGKPMHSWRVMILPYMEASAVYQDYDFNEPWNGPNNSKLAERMAHLYSCPSSAGVPNETSYVAVVGPETAWPGATSIKTRDIADGASNTIQLVEVANSGINWMEPRDLTLDEAIRGINKPGAKPNFSSTHSGGAEVVFFDGHTKLLPDETPPEAIRAALTIDGKETVVLPP